MSEPIGVQTGRVCPGCGREDSVPLLWGLPDSGAMDLAERGQVALGGCLVMGEDPDFFCRSCGLHWGRQTDPTADEHELAGLFGVHYVEVMRALGTGWRRESVPGEREEVQWFVSGEPAQVAVGVQGPFFVLARPLTRWGESRLGPLATDGPRFTRDDILLDPHLMTDAAEAIASSRRRSFRWCRTCRRATAPESFDSAEGSCERCVSIVADPE